MPEIALTQAPAHVRHGSNIGQPLTRRDGVLKVTGGARYAADNHPPGMLLCRAGGEQHRARPRHLPRRRGGQGASRRRRGHDARQPPGAGAGSGRQDHPFMFRLDLLQNDRVRYANQPIAVVIAETLEAATEGAALLAPRYEAEPARVGLDGDESFVPPAVGVGNPAEVQHGDVGGGPRGGGASHRRDLRNAGAISQRDGAARHRRGMGRRHAVDRHAEPGPGHGAAAASPGCSASRRRTSTSAAPSSAAASAPRA